MSNDSPESLFRKERQQRGDWGARVDDRGLASLGAGILHHKKTSPTVRFHLDILVSSPILQWEKRDNM